jgi:endonuclease YncB( thermonuclease family)
MVGFDFPRTIRSAQPRQLARTSDGDTPVIDQPVRMVSVDTPEKQHYAGLPPTAQTTLNRCRRRLQDGTYDALPTQLRDYLIGRLTPDAAERHIAAGLGASATFEALQEQRLTRPNGTRRRVAVIPTGEFIDRYGRLLAYLAPWFAGPPGDPLPPKDAPERRTFNLDMVASGWGALFLIYPSLPRNDDLNLLLEAAEAAWEERRGAWAAFGEDLLLGYEFRAAIKLGVKKLEDPDAAIAERSDRKQVGVHGDRGRSSYPEDRRDLRRWCFRSDPVGDRP